MDGANEDIKQNSSFKFTPPQTCICSKCQKEAPPALTVNGTTKSITICADCFIQVLEK